MKPGDLVRFRECVFHGTPNVYTPWKVGLLLEYFSWTKMATIMYKGKDYRIRASDVQLHKPSKTFKDH